MNFHIFRKGDIPFKGGICIESFYHVANKKEAKAYAKARYSKPVDVYSDAEMDVLRAEHGHNLGENNG